jgi:hypothetical protein
MHSARNDQSRHPTSCHSRQHRYPRHPHDSTIIPSPPSLRFVNTSTRQTRRTSTISSTSTSSHFRLPHRGARPPPPPQTRTFSNMTLHRTQQFLVHTFSIKQLRQQHPTRRQRQPELTGQCTRDAYQNDGDKKCIASTTETWLHDRPFLKLRRYRPATRIEVQLNGIKFGIWSQSGGEYLRYTFFI